jgi:hypothetical protein
MSSEVVNLLLAIAWVGAVIAFVNIIVLIIQGKDL